MASSTPISFAGSGAFPTATGCWGAQRRRTRRRSSTAGGSPVDLFLLILLGFSLPSGDFHRPTQPNVKAFALGLVRGTTRRRRESHVSVIGSQEGPGLSARLAPAVLYGR